MTDPAHALQSFTPQKDFFIGIDSDGCVFDSMELKHKECFCPAFINRFDLQAVSKYARETWDFVNLYSKTRGANRFHAVLRALDLLRERRETKERNISIPEMRGLSQWVARESKLGNPVLKAEVERTGDPDLERSYSWSSDVNAAVEKIVRNVPPFPHVRESLEKLTQKADALVVSQTPVEAIRREWKEHGIAEFVQLIAGQEMGTKTEHIALAAAGKYDADRILMIGDAPGDLKAAKANEALFYPIIPGREEESWQRLLEEGLDHFFTGTYKGSYEEALLEDFEASLPERAPWQK